MIVGQSLLIAALLFVFLRGWDRDFKVPLRFSRDSLSGAMQSKSTVDNGWWWFNPKVGAPFGLDELQYPANSNADQALVWVVSRVIRDPSTAINFTWFLMVVLSGLSATWCMSKLGVSRGSALVAGTLFAFTPYALYRNTGHFWLVIYLVPFACTAALFLASGRPDRWYWGRPFIGLLIGCALIAFNYAYYAFFGCFLLIVASLVGFIQDRTPRLLGAAALVVALICGGTILNLAPSLHSWQQRGKPLLVAEKTVAESEIYGLKIRQLVSPGLWHRFPPFSAWLAREDAAAFPLETENRSSRLGLVGALGFLALLGLLFVPRLGQKLRGHEMLTAASRLTLAAVLLGTIGGFGSLFSLLISPEIRAYNRISPFITFFSLTAVALILDSLIRSRTRRLVTALSIAIVGLADQRAAAVNVNATHKEIGAEVASLRNLVRDLESHLPADAMVFELPFRPYPNDEGFARMQPYDLLKPYLLSHTLRWSYPPLNNQQARLQLAAGLLAPQRLPRELAAAGFAAILVDRYGYADNGAATLAALQEQQADRGDVIGETPRYVVLDIRRLTSAAPPSSFLSRAASGSPASAGIAACTAQALFVVERIGAATPPFGEPPHLAGEVKVSGWAVDPVAQTTGAGVDMLIDQTLFQTIYGTDRGDVSAHFQQPAYRPSGFIGAVRTTGLAKGPHTLSLRVVSSDTGCYYETPPQPVVVD
ncbi:MAG: hypothetical protein ABI634_20210 [Acidobacteriota bacterium]